MRQWVGKNEAGQSVYDDFDAPAPVMKYRTYMGGVDRFDQVVQYYQQPFRNRRWPLAFFFWSFNVAISHGLTLYQCLDNPDAALKEYSVELAYQFKSACSRRSAFTKDQSSFPAQRIARSAQEAAVHGQRLQ